MLPWTEEFWTMSKTSWSDNDDDDDGIRSLRAMLSQIERATRIGRGERFNYEGR